MSKPNVLVAPLFGIAVLAFTVSLGARPASAEDLPKWAQESNERWYAANKAGDAEAMGRTYTEDAVLLAPDQTARGRKEIDQFHAANFAKTQSSCTWKIDHVDELEKLAVVWGQDSCVETPKGGGAAQTVKTRWMSVYERQQDGSWLTVRESFDELEP